MGWTKYQHKRNPRIRYWVQTRTFNGHPMGLFVGPTEEVRIKSTKNAYYDHEEKPPELCLPGGTFPRHAIHSLYERVEN